MPTTKNSLLVFFLIFSLHKSLGQKSIEKAAPEHIKTIIFKAGNTETRQQFPIVRLGDRIHLQFDDLNADEADYYYKVKHFNHDWQPSQLFFNEFLEGFDDLRIENYQTSFNTLQSYTHYELQLPNENTRFLVSGNYLLEVYNSYNEVVFSRLFCLYEEKASVQAGAFRPQQMNVFSSHQSIHFSITPINGSLRNINEFLHVTLLQNYQWDQIITGLKPQYFAGNTLSYRYEMPSQFEGGNEYRYFDTKDLRVTSPNISSINRANLFETYLYTDIDRQFDSYTFAPDINGDFEPRTLMGNGEATIEGDYSWVYFSLAKDYVLDDHNVYIYGKFNNYALSDSNKMYYNPSLELYEGVLLLKQGFYNYKYVVKANGQLFKNNVSGTHARTENEYTVLVYYRDLGKQYDALIGVGQANSFNLHL